MNKRYKDRVLSICGIFCLVWWLMIAAYWISVGEPFHLLWLCDLTLLITGIGILIKSPIMLSSQLVGTLPIQIAWNLDFWLRIISGSKVFGFTEYMFSTSHPAEVKILSTFHVFLPVFLIYAIILFGYEIRGWIWQSILTVFVYFLSYFTTDVIQNTNWTLGPFWKPQTMLPECLYLIIWTLLTLLMYFILHIFLTKILKIKQIPIK
jgi:hypothetical protein